MSNKSVNDKINNIIDNIPQYPKDDPEYEMKIFTYIYVKLSTLLTYSDRAVELINMGLSGYDRERAYDCVVIPASTIDCLERRRSNM